MSSRYIITHSERFHTDDVFACALLALTFDIPITNIIRTRDLNRIHEMWILSESFIVDVGLKYRPDNRMFDHHQNGCHETFNSDVSTPLSSYGMVYKEYHKKLFEKLSEPTYDALAFYKRYVESVDANDNGVSVFCNIYDKIYRTCKFNKVVEALKTIGVDVSYMSPLPRFRELTVQDIINAYLPEDKNYDAAFLRAVTFAMKMLEEFVRSHAAYTREKMKNAELFLKHYKGTMSKVAVFDFDFQYDESSLPDNVLFTVLPRGTTGKWQIHTISTGKYTHKADILGEEECRVIAGDDFEFVHNNKFIAVCKTQKAAIKIATISAKKYVDNKLILIFIIYALVILFALYNLWFV